MIHEKNFIYFPDKRKKEKKNGKSHCNCMTSQIVLLNISHNVSLDAHENVSCIASARYKRSMRFVREYDPKSTSSPNILVCPQDLIQFHF